jgi:bifunctional N-acetylglucosamine-1-phosphate-uridyltransferase/glucosamine-1-phosphate-acetyltransferase GlmU-like protein
MIKIVIPMAGKALRMNSLEYLSKPLNNVSGLTTIEKVVETLNIPGHYILIILKNKNDKINKRLKAVLGILIHLKLLS